jgi:hypothetical protein
MSKGGALLFLSYFFKGPLFAFAKKVRASFSGHKKVSFTLGLVLSTSLRRKS